MARRQEGWLVRDQREGALTVLALGGALLVLAIAFPMVYRRWVPARWKEGRRAWWLTPLALALLGMAGYAIAGLLFGGAIKG